MSLHENYSQLVAVYFCELNCNVNEKLMIHPLIEGIEDERKLVARYFCELKHNVNDELMIHPLTEGIEDKRKTLICSISTYINMNEICVLGVIPKEAQ
ncbi:hypothetical protein AMTR_s00188p00039400 [Amborella trichopoda]|uniref:Uncharacterized protein n=1 Tax=Amborella trichopoda TaxID=13333 RepID=W1NJV7_AMBTC|nr:hypothetical protein AMTR_s00188p00039400 [Amborella trichopoda]